MKDVLAYPVPLLASSSGAVLPKRSVKAPFLSSA